MADLAGRQPESRGGVGQQPHLHLRDEHLVLRLQIDDPRDAVDRLLDFISLGPQHGKIRPVHTDNDGRPRAREDFFDPFLEIRQQVALQARIAIDGGLNFFHGRGKVVFWIDADPELGEIRAVNFISNLRPADVRAKIPHAGNRPQLLRGLRRDTHHRIERCARLFNPVHEKVGLLKIRQEFFAQPRDGNARGDKGDDNDAKREHRPSDQRRQPAAIDGFQHVGQRRVMPFSMC